MARPKYSTPIKARSPPAQPSPAGSISKHHAFDGPTRSFTVSGVHFNWRCVVEVGNCVHVGVSFGDAEGQLRADAAMRPAIVRRGDPVRFQLLGFCVYSRVGADGRRHGPQNARRWSSAADLPDMSKCFSGKNSRAGAPRYFAWGCFQYFGWGAKLARSVFASTAFWLRRKRRALWSPRGIVRLNEFQKSRALRHRRHLASN
jgi:hypothetical protein